MKDYLGLSLSGFIVAAIQKRDEAHVDRGLRAKELAGLLLIGAVFLTVEWYRMSQAVCSE